MQLTREHTRLKDLVEIMVAVVCERCAVVDRQQSFSSPIERAGSGSGEGGVQGAQVMFPPKWRSLSWAGQVVPSSEDALSDAVGLQQIYSCDSAEFVSLPFTDDQCTGDIYLE